MEASKWNEHVWAEEKEKARSRKYQSCFRSNVKRKGIREIESLIGKRKGIR